MKDNDISYLRFVAIIAIVLHHSFCAFDVWPPNHLIGGYTPEWAMTVSSTLKAIGLSVFTFISGYLLYFQSQKYDTYFQFFKKKVYRIIVPCLFWAVIYGILFTSFMYDNWPAPINGTHLWYLPMLFICILVVSFDLYVKRWNLLLWGVIWLLTYLLSKITPIRTFGEIFQYLPVFIVGYWFNKYKLRRLVSSKMLIRMSMALLVVLCCVLSCLTMSYYFDIIMQMALISIVSFLVVCLLRQQKALNKIENVISDNSFSIYLMHQFIINSLLLFVPFKIMGFYTSFFILALSALFVPVLVSFLFDRTKMLINVK